jgi:uncharacterized membrane protein YfcA
MPLWVPLAFFLAAIVYAAAGFGGGSAYLAVLSVSGLPYQSMPQTALLCNVAVSIGGVWHFHRGGHLAFKRVLPFFVLSTPLAFAGGRIQIDRELFSVLLGVSLFAAGIHMLIPRPEAAVRVMSASRQWVIGLPVGGALGFLSGLVGIGGGVFLAPVLLIFGWTTPKQTAATASLFIFVNSVAGLTGQVVKGAYIGWMSLALVVAAVLGGQIGSRTGAYRMSSANIRRLLAAVIMVVGGRLLWKAL